MITILGGEILSALGEKKERMKHLSDTTYSVDTKKMTTVLDEELSFSYYSIDDGERNSALSIPLQYLKMVI